MTAANFSDFFKRNYMVLTYLQDRPAFSTSKAFNLYLFSQVMTYEGHNSFLLVSDYPLPTQKCVTMLLILIEFFEKSVQPLKHTFQITLYSNF